MRKIFKVTAQLKKLGAVQKNIEVTDDYTRGLHNGLELARSILMSREPNFKE